MAVEATIKVQRRSNGNDHDALDLLKRGAIRSDSIVSHRFPLEKGQEAFETMEAYRDGGHQTPDRVVGRRWPAGGLKMVSQALTD